MNQMNQSMIPDHMTQVKAYAGIGSRETPEEILELMTYMAQELSSQGLILRSGGAEGADTAFELGAEPGTKEIYLPWDGFNERWATEEGVFNQSRSELEEIAMGMASHFHPRWDRCGYGTRKLMARNVHQVIGKDLLSPCLFILCWTRGGTGLGGTGQALRIARELGIPVYDLGVMSLEEVSEGVTETLAAFP